MVTRNNGEEPKQNSVIIVSKRVHNYLTRQHELTGNEHALTILNLIKDSKEYREINPGAPYPDPLKWNTKDLPRVKITNELYGELLAFRIDGMRRARTAEYSNTRVLNDLLHDSEELNKMQQEAYKEIENNGDKNTT